MEKFLVFRATASLGTAARHAVVPVLFLATSFAITTAAEAQIILPRQAKPGTLTGTATSVGVATPVNAVEMTQLAGHIAPVVAMSTLIGDFTTPDLLTVDLCVPMRDMAGMKARYAAIYDPSGPLYGQYMTPDQIASEFGATQGTYDSVIAYAQSLGLTVIQTEPGRTYVTVGGTQAQIEAAFGVHLGLYQDPNGRVFHAPMSEPMIATSMVGSIQAIAGLSDSFEVHPLMRRRAPKATKSVVFLDPPSSKKIISGASLASEQGTGYLGAFTVADIHKAFNLTNNLTGAGQVLGLYELDTYVGKDIQKYELDNGIKNSPVLENVYVDTTQYARGGNTGEVVLDIDLEIALAPGASRVIVYTAPLLPANGNYSFQYVIDTYTKIQTENRAKQISTSWGGAEGTNESALSSFEDPIFVKMGMQGQSMYAASGDDGSYDNGSNLSVDDPAVEPDVCGVGGTTLLVQSAGSNEAYKSETVWNNFPFGVRGAGGGGVSQYLAIPTYQKAAASYSLASSSGSGISTTFRNVPDVSLDADPQTGYSIYVTESGASTGSYEPIGGTSCAAPLWAGFTALVNQNRLRLGQATLGFPNATLYNFAPTAANPTGSSTNGQGTTSLYASIFHDITSGNNSHTGSTAAGTPYPAITGFDNATGLGTFNGNPMIIALSGALP